MTADLSREALTPQALKILAEKLGQSPPTTTAQAALLYQKAGLPDAAEAIQKAHPRPVCVHPSPQRFGDQALYCASCGTLLNLHTLQTRQLNGDLLLLHHLQNTTKPKKDKIAPLFASDPLPPEPPNLPGEGPPLAADPLAPVIFHGPTGTGKTSYLAKALSARPNLHALYLAGEGLQWIHGRLQAWHPNPENVLILPPPYPHQTDTYQTITRQHPPDILVLDPYAALTSNYQLPENDAQTPLQIRDLLHEITNRELPILIAHAERKPSETAVGIHRIRGSSALPALASITHRVTTDHRGLSYAKNTKNRASPLDPTRWQLNLQTGQLQHTQKSDTPATDKALQALRNLPQPATKAEWQKALPDTPLTPLLIQTLRDNQQIKEIPNHRGRHPGYKPAPQAPW